LLITQKIEDPAKKKAITDFLQWMLADGQNMLEALAYARLPQEVIALEKRAIAKIQ
jgi:ABC-type phosphate transport system substrate-binding protein